MKTAMRYVREKGRNEKRERASVTNKNREQTCNEKTLGSAYICKIDANKKMTRTG